MRVTNFPTAGAYELTRGLGYKSGDYGKSTWAYGCMQVRATNLARIPWRLKRGDKVLQRHNLIRLLEEFGPEMNWVDAILATEIDLLLMGAAYWLRDGSELRRLNPNTMKVKRSSSGIVGFTQTINNKETTFDRDEVAYYREFHPTDDLGPGVAPIDVARRDILTEYECSRYVDAFFKNDAIPGVLLSTEQVVPEKEMNKIKKWWNARFRGATKHHKVAFADRGLTAKILTSNLKEMALADVRDEARRNICAAFKVPMQLVGDLDVANYATAREARKSLYEDTLIPRAQYLASVINTELIQPLNPEIVFEFAPEELEIMQEDEDEKAARMVLLVKNKIITREKAADELGYALSDLPEEQPAPASEVNGDLRKWERKAMKSFKKGNSANVPFDTDEIPMEQQMAIRSLLENVAYVGEIEAVFHDHD